ncbi:hypothetical protein F3Y22_tig00110450pilonHSYRG01182 [Hibiscus syriacus]|uniref:Uncharacterized protein n=1 Tax=Hibiscus syriacus TaxID=106335 RepID=A0A6A3AMM7_HIBSY|nr:hypothetical protein F3Y22_tig00110450pilonHSYRG01182 [Hibiscus syriacus]
MILVSDRSIEEVSVSHRSYSGDSLKSEDVCGWCHGSGASRGFWRGVIVALELRQRGLMNGPEVLSSCTVALMDGPEVLSSFTVGLTDDPEVLNIKKLTNACLNTSCTVGLMDGPEVLSSCTVGLMDGPEVLSTCTVGLMDSPEVLSSFTIGLMDGPEVLSSYTVGLMDDPEVLSSCTVGLMDGPEVLSSCTVGLTDDPEALNIKKLRKLSFRGKKSSSYLTSNLGLKKTNFISDQQMETPYDLNIGSASE